METLLAALDVLRDALDVGDVFGELAPFALLQEGGQDRTVPRRRRHRNLDPGSLPTRYPSIPSLLNHRFLPRLWKVQDRQPIA